MTGARQGTHPGTLHFLCGKMAAGKTTCAKALARTHEAMLLEEDHFLATLFPGAIRSVADYLTYSGRVRDALAAHIVALLRSGITVVLDFRDHELLSGTLGGGGLQRDRKTRRTRRRCRGLT